MTCNVSHGRVLLSLEEEVRSRSFKSFARPASKFSMLSVRRQITQNDSNRSCAIRASMDKLVGCGLSMSAPQRRLRRDPLHALAQLSVWRNDKSKATTFYLHAALNTSSAWLEQKRLIFIDDEIV